MVLASSINAKVVLVDITWNEIYQKEIEECPKRGVFWKVFKVSPPLSMRTQVVESSFQEFLDVFSTG